MTTRVAALLQGKGHDVLTVTPDSSVGALVKLLAERRIGALPVVDGDGRLKGIVSERDVVRTLSARGESVLQELVSSIMSSTVHTCSPDDDTESLMRIMTERRIRHVPVVDGGRLSGIVSIGDVVKDRIEELEKNKTELIEYITAR